jgi:metal-dependent amidase/aminoacylase/carboxypeptidase family protein
METYVRGKTMEAIKSASVKVNRALRAGAMAIGAEVSIEKLPGYLPRLNCAEFTEVFGANASALVGDAAIQQGKHGSGSSDIGDLMHIMPAIHPTCGGAEGGAHSERFSIKDPVDAYILPAKLMALTVVDLLWDNAEKAKSIIGSFKPVFTKEEYFANWNEVLASSDVG